VTGNRSLDHSRPKRRNVSLSPVWVILRSQHERGVFFDSEMAVKISEGSYKDENRRVGVALIVLIPGSFMRHCGSPSGRGEGSVAGPKCLFKSVDGAQTCAN